MKTEEIFNGFDDIIRKRFGDECFEVDHVEDEWLLDSKVADRLFKEHEHNLYFIYGWGYDVRFVDEIMPELIKEYREKHLESLMSDLRAEAECEHQRAETLKCYRRWG